jgi:hypothetical protein
MDSVQRQQIVDVMEANWLSYGEFIALAHYESCIRAMFEYGELREAIAKKLCSTPKDETIEILKRRLECAAAAIPQVRNEAYLEAVTKMRDMLNNVMNPERSVATDDDSSNTAK